MGRIIVGITGASGVIYGIRLLEVLRDLKVEAHLILTEAAQKNIQIETSFTVEDVEGLAYEVHDVRDLAAPVSSGSFVTSGMVVAPCSIKTLSAIAHSYNDNLLVRAADVTLKERRRLVLLVRETPLHLGHLELMAQVARLGGVIMPPVPAFYHRPRSVEEIVDQTVGKVLGLFGIETDLFRRWGC